MLIILFQVSEQWRSSKMVAACLAPQRFQSSGSGPVLHQPLTTLTEDELAMKDTGKLICCTFQKYTSKPLHRFSKSKFFFHEIDLLCVLNDGMYETSTNYQIIS